jgi:hypothetical protein
MVTTMARQALAITAAIATRVRYPRIALSIPFVAGQFNQLAQSQLSMTVTPTTSARKIAGRSLKQRQSPT